MRSMVEGNPQGERFMKSMVSRKSRKEQDPLGA
jgi:hypothetical protein